MKPIYYRAAQPDGTLGFRVIWPANYFVDASEICFVLTEEKAKEVVAWLTEAEEVAK
jgi:hypothetical protein